MINISIFPDGKVSISPLHLHAAITKFTLSLPFLRNRDMRSNLPPQKRICRIFFMWIALKYTDTLICLKWAFWPLWSIGVHYPPSIWWHVFNSCWYSQARKSWFNCLSKEECPVVTSIPCGGGAWGGGGSRKGRKRGAEGEGWKGEEGEEEGGRKELPTLMQDRPANLCEYDC